MGKIEIKSIDEILAWKLCIPKYQRPYKWSIKNINDLLSDIDSAIKESSKHTDFKYRIGTIILHAKQGKDEFDIVDGQQRIISLLLIRHCIENSYDCTFLKESRFTDKDSQNNISKNYAFIKEWFFMKKDLNTEFINAYKDILQVVVIKVDEISEAFQLFDGQNSRGKALDPHDLLKAYHLREMKHDRYAMEHAVEKWEDHNTDEIRELFEFYLFPVLNWSNKRKGHKFTDKDIDKYKGICEISNYSYAKRAKRATPYYQITEEFISGNDFFEMIEHYLHLLKIIKTEICTNDKFKIIKATLCNGKEVNTPEDMDAIKYNSTGFMYARNLFLCALLHYYDRFHNFDSMAVTKLFVWAFMLRVDITKLGLASINKYAIGDTDGRYTNKIAMFAKIREARVHNEISGIMINMNRKNEDNKTWKELYEKLEIIMGIRE